MRIGISATLTEAPQTTINVTDGGQLQLLVRDLVARQYIGITASREAMHTFLSDAVRELQRYIPADLSDATGPDRG